MKIAYPLFGRVGRSLLGGMILFGFAATTAQAQIADDLETLLTDGKVKLDVRYRFEFVNDDLTPQNANASTVRTRLGFLTGNLRGLQGYVEMENTSAIFANSYNVPGASPHGPNKPGRAIVADPEFTELNQVWAQYTGPKNTVLRGGRQRVKLDNDRFIGNVGWRQNEQTYDAITLNTDVLPQTHIFYGYFFRANTILGTNRDMNSHIINVRYSGLPYSQLVAYAYLLDFDPGMGTDSRTFGVRFSGAAPVGEDFKVIYWAEYANQGDYQDSADFSADYLRLELGGSYRGVTIKGGYELLGSDGGTAAFQTPLATLHAQNGWADRFLATPAAGLEDFYAVVSTKISRVKMAFIYHDFSADKGGGGYGQEIDVVATTKIHKRVTFGLKFAAYNADNAGAGPVNNDVQKFWTWLGLKF